MRFASLSLSPLRLDNAVPYDKLAKVKTFGAVEAGGTKFVCGWGTGPDHFTSVSFPTTTPVETLTRVTDYFGNTGVAIEAVGIGCFGPVDLRRNSPTWGHITTTPKTGWRNVDVAGALSSALSVPVGFDTDVNVAALGEARWGAAQDIRNCVYLTIGTGIGGGAIVDGRVVHGMLHPEMGHMRIPHDCEADPFAGSCPFHGDCLEGLAAGPALEARWGRRAETLPPDHSAWALEARYLALAAANLVLTLSPERIILGGGVMHQTHLFPLIRRELKAILADYVQAVPLQQMDNYVVPPTLGNRAGLLGALALAQSLGR